MTASEERKATLVAEAGAFGRWLLQERDLRGLSRDEVARLTKLGPALIDALESGDPERMPPKAYVFGYLRSYAAVVGLDGDDVVLRWQEVVGADVGSPSSPTREPLRWQSIALGGVALALAILLAVALFAPRRERPLQLRRVPSAGARAPYPAAPPDR